jgi:hypothetical protein
VADTQVVLREIDELRARAGLAGIDDPALGVFNNRGSSLLSGLLTSWNAAIQRFSSPKSAYSESADSILKGRGNLAYKATQMHGVLMALRADYEAGYLRAIEELIHADVFGDFLEMADELHKKGYKDPAAVIAGSVLEEHLRKLADRYGIATSVAGRPKKADTINADLVKGGAYNKLEQKSVTAWLGLRNDAAHGNYAAYDDTQVGLLIQSVREFLTRHPA